VPRIALPFRESEPIQRPDIWQPRREISIKGRRYDSHAAEVIAAMSWLMRPAAVLAWLGRQGTRAVALSLFAGLALPWLAALFKPAFTPSVFVLLTLAFLRVDPSALRRRFRAPGLVLAGAAWMVIATPLICGFPLVALGFDRGLLIALILQIAAPPTNAASALAALMGLDAALALAVLTVCAIATPVTAAAFASVFLGTAMDLSPLALGLRLFAMLAAAAAIAALVRRAAGQAWVERQAERIDGLSVIALFVFAVAVMDGVVAQTVARPQHVLGFLALAFAMSLVLGAATAAVFWRAGRNVALTLALSAGLRNVGLMGAAAGGVPATTWLYIAMAQFPIYLLPHALKAALDRFARRTTR
jgi:BASS family bile acid:Na+ symporter